MRAILFAGKLVRMVPVVSFFVSAVLIALLFVLRHTEIKRERRFLPLVRERFDGVAERVVVYLSRRLPRQIAGVGGYIVIHITDIFSSTLLHGIRFVEGKLHRFVRVVRGRKHVKMGEPTSSYFHDVRNHKEQVRRENGHS